MLQKCHRIVTEMFQTCHSGHRNSRPSNSCPPNLPTPQATSGASALELLHPSSLDLRPQATQKLLTPRRQLSFVWPACALSVTLSSSNAGAPEALDPQTFDLSHVTKCHNPRTDDLPQTAKASHRRPRRCLRPRSPLTAQILDCPRRHHHHHQRHHHHHHHLHHQSPTITPPTADVLQECHRNVTQMLQKCNRNVTLM